MTSPLDSAPDVCTRLKHLGYSASQHIKLYGEEYEIVSDPFFEAEGVALRVRTSKDPKVRTLQLPSTILQTVRRGSFARAA
jgi:hypothetical protein